MIFVCVQPCSLLALRGQLPVKLSIMLICLFVLEQMWELPALRRFDNMITNSLIILMTTCVNCVEERTHSFCVLLINLNMYTTVLSNLENAEKLQKSLKETRPR